MGNELSIQTALPNPAAQNIPRIQLQNELLVMDMDQDHHVMHCTDADCRADV